MKFKLFVIICFTLSTFATAQINAITENGDEVVLMDNKTWKYVNDSLNSNIEILKNETLFKKHKKSSFLVKSSKSNIGIYLNPKSWSFQKEDEDKAAEYNFQHKKMDIWAMLITEKTQIPLESLAEIAYSNAIEVAPDLEIISKEYRNVNGIEVIMMQMKGTIQKVKFIYFGYYFSNEQGAYQLLTYTSFNLFDEYQSEMQNMLNGLTVY